MLLDYIENLIENGHLSYNELSTLVREEMTGLFIKELPFRSDGSGLSQSNILSEIDVDKSYPILLANSLQGEQDLEDFVILMMKEAREYCDNMIREIFEQKCYEILDLNEKKRVQGKTTDLEELVDDDNCCRARDMISWQKYHY